MTSSSTTANLYEGKRTEKVRLLLEAAPFLAGDAVDILPIREYNAQMSMEYASVEEMARLWGISPRSVRNYCAHGRIADAVFRGKTWMIPAEADKPRRKARFDQVPQSVSEILKMEMEAKMKGGLYHRLQIDFTYNSNRDRRESQAALLSGAR